MKLGDVIYKYNITFQEQLDSLEQAGEENSEVGVSVIYDTL